MKPNFFVLIAVFTVSTGLSMEEAERSHNDNIVDEAKAMEMNFRPWMPSVGATDGRISFLFAETLPEGIRKLGYTRASIEEGFVILISSDHNALFAKGIAITTNDKNPSQTLKTLKTLGWEASVSDDPRIIHLKQKKQNKAEMATPRKPSD